MLDTSNLIKLLGLAQEVGLETRVVDHGIQFDIDGLIYWMHSGSSMNDVNNLFDDLVELRKMKEDAAAVKKRAAEFMATLTPRQQDILRNMEENPLRLL